MRFCSFVFLFLLFSSPLAQARDLRVALGVQGLPTAASAASGNKAPQNGLLKAFNEDLAREICRRMHVRCVTGNFKFGDILPGIEANKFELGFGNFLRTPAREERVGFSDSIWRSASRLVTTPATARLFAAQADISLDALHGARIVALADSEQYRYLQSLADKNGLTVLAVDTIADAFTLLREDRADFCLLPILIAYNQFNSEAAGKFEFFGAPEAGRGLGGTVHIALPKGDEALRLAVNKAIAALRADGTYHRIVRKYFPFSLE